jgi:hypothetical protein
MATEAFQKTFKELKRFGLLLLSDSHLPSITTLLVGEPIRGSWWGHPKGREIFRVASRIDEHPDVAITKLISGKVTFVHRKLWPALLAVATARAPWQMNGLSRKARNLLQMVDQAGEIEMDRLPTSPKTNRSAWNEAARELEKRLLIYAEEFHSETGAHVKRLESWNHWATRKKLKPQAMMVGECKKRMVVMLLAINKRFDGKARLPWMNFEGDE